MVDIEILVVDITRFRKTEKEKQGRTKKRRRSARTKRGRNAWT